MSTVTVNGSALGTALDDMLGADTIMPGSAPSYQLCKTIYTYHPLGAKIAEEPIREAMAMERNITVPDGPEGMIVEAFTKKWDELDVDKKIFSVHVQARIYGIASIGMVIDGEAAAAPLDLRKYKPGTPISFNTMDPLNTAGSLVMEQDPNKLNYQRPTTIEVQGVKYHSSRCCIVMNEEPIYIEWTSSAFGYVGRSAYQRALFPLKTFIQSMKTDDMVTIKAGLLIAMIKAAGSIIDNIMAKIGAFKRSLLQEGATGGVLQVGADDKIETLNMMNTDLAMTTARKNCIENIATAVPMPAKMINSESFAEGFGEGTEDAKKVARFVDGVRDELRPTYAFFDPIVMQLAWDKEFFARVQALHPEQYPAEMTYETAFYRWKNSFAYEWPSLLTEPASELAKTDKVKLEAITEIVGLLLPQIDPDNKATLINWMCDNLNEMDMMFPNPLVLDAEALANYEPPIPTLTDVVDQPSGQKPKQGLKAA